MTYVVIGLPFVVKLIGCGKAKIGCGREETSCGIGKTDVENFNWMWETKN